MNQIELVPYHQLKQQFKCAAIPMVGFGFMDNTIGFTFGLATLVAAGFGQVLSDSSGVVFGNSLEAFLGKRLNLTPPDVTPLQRGSFRFRMVTTGGALLGVIFG